MRSMIVKPKESYIVPGDPTLSSQLEWTYRPSGTARVGVIGVPGGTGRGGPPTTIPAGSFSTHLGLHGPEINIRAVTAETTKAAIIGQLILLISQSSAQPAF